MFTTTDEQAFRAWVEAHRDIGYGRMMQIVSHVWWREDPTGAHCVTIGAYAIMPEQEQRELEALARHDPVFAVPPTATRAALED